MLLLTAERYTIITGDGTSPASAVSAALEDAQDLLTEDLGRPGITLEEYTETLRLTAIGTAFPNVTPIVTPPEGITYSVGGFNYCTPDGGPFPDGNPAVATVTYTGGWDSLTVPASVRMDLAWAAWRLLHPTTPMPAGATVISNGDASVTFDRARSGSDVIGWSGRTLRYRRRRI